MDQVPNCKIYIWILRFTCKWDSLVSLHRYKSFFLGFETDHRIKDMNPRILTTIFTSLWGGLSMWWTLSELESSSKPGRMMQLNFMDPRLPTNGAHFIFTPWKGFFPCATTCSCVCYILGVFLLFRSLVWCPSCWNSPYFFLLFFWME